MGYMSGYITGILGLYRDNIGILYWLYLHSADMEAKKKCKVW